MNKKIGYQIIAIGIIIILIVSAAIYLYTDTEEEKEEDEEELIVVDDRISPLVNQGLILEVHRIRHRGLLDEIVQMGNGWKDTPQFYFISDIDGTEYVSKNVYAAGGASSEQLFVCWDSIGQANKIQHDAEEDVETSSVKLTVSERVSSGFLGRKSDYVVREEIDVTYDYRTGRWTGDDSFMDKDGYGHYLGDTFEVWFDIYQFGADDDRIPYWVEVNVLGTNPTIDDSKKDPDNDGIPTDWEWRWGYDPFVWDDHEQLDPDIDGIENIEEYQVRKYFSDPYRRDIYVEFDGMEKGGFLDSKHYFPDESAQILIERFSQHGINVYIDNGWRLPGPNNAGGELLPHIDTISQDSGMIVQFYENNFPDERKGIFRYGVVGHNAGFCHPSFSNSYDTLSVGSSLYKQIFNRYALTARTQRIVIASAAMHELGHSQGIGSWTFAGVDDFDASKDYKSVMNYNWIFDKKLLDYSSGENGAPNDQDDWSVLYLPAFQLDSEVVEGPNYADLSHYDERISAVVEKDSFYISQGWEVDEGLSNEIADVIGDEEEIYDGDGDYLILMKTDGNSKDMQDGRNIRVYFKPDVSPVCSAWSLVYEGKYDPSDDSFEFYSSEDIVDDLMDLIK